MSDHREDAEQILARSMDYSERRVANDDQLMPLIVLAIAHTLLSIDERLRALVRKP